MRSDTACPKCGEAVRSARCGDKSLLLDLSPSAHGYIEVLDFEDGVPVVRVAGTHDELVTAARMESRSLGLTYGAHYC